MRDRADVRGKRIPTCGNGVRFDRPKFSLNVEINRMDMADMQKELERLRAEVAALSAARQQESTPAAAEQPAASSFAASSSELARDSGLKHQFEELLELMEKELRDLPTFTCLAVFSLGIILGRYLR